MTMMGSSLWPSSSNASRVRDGDGPPRGNASKRPRIDSMMEEFAADHEMTLSISAQNAAQQVREVKIKAEMPGEAKHREEG
jgi:hypothetical protein